MDTVMRAWRRLRARPALRQGALALVDQTVASGTNFAAGVVIGRTCSREEFGLYALGFTVILVLVRTQNALISVPYTVVSPRLEEPERTAYTGSTLVHHLGLSAAAVLGLLAAGAVLSWRVGPAGLARVMWALAAAVTFVLLRAYARRVCFASLKMAQALLVDIAVAAIQIGGLLLLARAGALSASRAYLPMGLACAVAGVTWLAASRRRMAVCLQRVMPDLQRNWGLGRWLFLDIVANTFGVQTYPWLLAVMHGTASTGVLAAAMTITFFANPFLYGMANLLGPKTAHAFATGGAREVRRTVFQATLFFAAVMGVFCATLLAVGGLLVTLVYGDKYAGQGLVVAILALGQLSIALVVPVTSGLAAVERTDALFVSSLLTVGVTVTVGVWLVYALGPVGAALGILAGSVVASTARLVAFLRATRARP